MSEAKKCNFNIIFYHLLLVHQLLFWHSKKKTKIATFISLRALNSDILTGLQAVFFHLNR